ncbi:polysaccharide biosynthesis protein [Solwaraspora sp. WMMB335]|uniref:polysaccharide biosynthesis protein n=1 Tax=Solwaraspora sp. WMMB335 TaxID=3404118 RepID=UPI003B957CBB
MADALTGCRVLITGGTGSFGRTMARYLLDTSIAEVRVLSRDEAKQDTMRRAFDDGRLRFQLGDVRDPDTVRRACRDMDFVFHAAALKQVPSGEFFPLEAVRTNVLGSAAVIEAAERTGVRTVVTLSTDKAVYPVSAMGMSKALMEKLVQSYVYDRRPNGPVVSCVRYGNVLYSRGSVLPLFVEQIRQGRPLTVTDPRMTRFLMSLPDAVDLVARAFTQAQPGDIFIRKAPACTVADLAEAVCTVFEVAPKTDVIGVRHGEKTAETLATAHELARADDLGEVLRVPADTRGLNYHSDLPAGVGPGGDRGGGDFTSDTATRLTVAQLVELLGNLPEIRSEVGAGELVMVG